MGYQPTRRRRLRDTICAVYWYTQGKGLWTPHEAIADLAHRRSTMRPGPSNIYLRLLQGHVTAEHYCNVLRRATAMHLAHARKASTH